jgi:hypothetical protein
VPDIIMLQKQIRTKPYYQLAVDLLDARLASDLLDARLASNRQERVAHP